MSPIRKLRDLFSQFPGIGPRQAARFVYFLAAQDDRYIDELSHAIAHLKQSVTHCALCTRLFTPRAADVHTCDICGDANRDRTTLLIVSKDADLEAIERTDTYTGTYFVVGGIINTLEKNPEQKIRLPQLEKRIATHPVSEVILALPANPDGDATAQYLAQTISHSSAGFACKISTLGRGLSTGLEIEYSDPETLKNAFQNRT